MKISSKNKNKKQIPKEIKIDLSSLYYKNNKENNQYINTQQTYNSKINNYSNYNKSENKINNKKFSNIENYNFINNSESFNNYIDTSNNYYYNNIILTTRHNNNNKKLLHNFSQKKFLKFNSPQQLFIKNSRINREIEQPSEIKKILSVENFAINNNNNYFFKNKIYFIVYIQKIYKGYKFRKYFKNFLYQNKFKTPKNYGKIINLKPSNNKLNKQIYTMKIDIPIISSKKINIITKNKNSNYISKNIIINQKYDLKCLIYIQKIYKKYFKIKIIKKLLNNSLQTLPSLNNSKINTPRNTKNKNEKNNFNNNKLSEISAIKNTSENNSFISGYNRKCSSNLFFDNSYIKTEKEKNDFKDFNKIIKPPKSSYKRVFIQNKMPKKKQLLFNRTKNNSAFDLSSFKNESNLNNIIYKKPKSRENSFSKQIEIKNEKNINNVYYKNKNIFCHKKFLTNFTQETKCSERYEDSVKNIKNDLGIIQNISHFSIDNENEQKQTKQFLEENIIEYIIKFIYFIFRNYSNYKNSLILFNNVKTINNKIFSEINFKYQIIFLIFNLLNEKNFLNLFYSQDLINFHIIDGKLTYKINNFEINNNIFKFNIDDKLLNDNKTLYLFFLIKNRNNFLNKKIIHNDIENNNNNEKIENKLTKNEKNLNNFIFSKDNNSDNIDYNLNNNFVTKIDSTLLNNIKTNIYKNNNQIVNNTNFKHFKNYFIIDNNFENNLKIFDNIFCVKPLLKNSINIKNSNVKENNIININEFFNNLNIKKRNKNIIDKKSIKIRYLKFKGKENIYLNLDNIFTKKPVKKKFKEIYNKSCKISIINNNKEEINNSFNENYNNNILNYTSQNKFFKKIYINNNIEKENKIELERKKIMCQPIPKNKFNYNVLLLDIKQKINIIININLNNEIKSKYINKKNKKFNFSNFYYKINENEDKLNLYD